jgi:hypothetical protein
MFFLPRLDDLPTTTPSFPSQVCSIATVLWCLNWLELIGWPASEGIIAEARCILPVQIITRAG